MMPPSGSALLRTALGLAGGEVCAYPAQSLECRPGPLVRRFGDHKRVAEGSVALRARRHELEGVPFRERIGAGHQEMVTYLPVGIRLSKRWIPVGQVLTSSVNTLVAAELRPDISVAIMCPRILKCSSPPGRLSADQFRPVTA
jgi:hypothetical protein